MGPEPEIVVVGGADEARIEVLRELRKTGLTRVSSVATLSLDQGVPDLLILTGADVRGLCAQARETPPLAGVPILAVVPAIPPEEATAVLAAGADEVARPPLIAAILGARARQLARAARARRDLVRTRKAHRAAITAQEHMALRGPGPEGLRDALTVIAQTLGFDRGSIIAHIQPSESAYVIAATDDPTLSKFSLRIDDYPEVVAAMERDRPVLIPDVLSDPITASVADRLHSKNVRGMVVFPVRTSRRPLGVILLRRERPGVDDVDDSMIELGELFAKQVALQLGHGNIIQSLKEQTGRISRARYEAERRLRMIDSLKEHFEAAADGVVVLDEDGRILFVNNAAERITGFARDGLLGAPLIDLVPSLQAEVLQEVTRSVLSGTNLEAFDLDLSTTAGEAIVVSVTTSTVLSTSGAVILSFRDVTAQRALETEVRRTKEFLERLIDSTVDAIVAADTQGTVILFNQGAERIYGYAAEDVVGRMPVANLYPEGVAQQVMRMLRSVSYGGVGRLEQTRREIVNKHGELVPVNMTASILYEDGKEVATVGIFSDLRERIRIEQRLLQAQEKLQLTEQQAMLAELAGAAAHELNQPLTSIIGYSQLIQRQSEADAAHLRAVNVILHEAERMADIVKKIGRITKFETKEYVGEATILDLDASAAASSPDLVIPDPLPAPPGSDDETATEDDEAVEMVAELPPQDDDGGVDFAGEMTGADAGDDGVTTKIPVLEPHEHVTSDEPTVVGHRARLFGENGEFEGDETLDEIELEQALDGKEAK